MPQQKRTLENYFFSPTTTSHSKKKTRTTATVEIENNSRIISGPATEKSPNNNSPQSSSSSSQFSNHFTYPFPIPYLPSSISSQLSTSTSSVSALRARGRGEGKGSKEIWKGAPPEDLDLLYFHPFIPNKNLARSLFEFLRKELFFYRVQYKIKRGGGGNIDTVVVNTPRFTTVFGVDETSRFAAASSDNNNLLLVDAQSLKPIIPPYSSRYKTCKPRPIPQCLDQLRKLTELHTCGVTYNFCLVNYYSNGNDSISYHSDDERFLEKEPVIASLSLGAPREFLMKHKPRSPPPPAPPDEAQQAASSALFQMRTTARISSLHEKKEDKDKDKNKNNKPRKISLESGDMLLMRGPTQANWLHSVPKTKGGAGRINITFRKAMVRSGTENYYCYNVGEGREVFKWDERKQEMALWTGRICMGDNDGRAAP